MSHRASFYIMLSRYKDAGRLFLFLAVAVLLAFLLANGQATADALLQSPQSPPPVEESQPEPPPPTPTPPPPPPTPTPVPTEPPPEPVEAEPTAQEPLGAASTEAIQVEPSPTQPPVEPSPTLPPPTPTPLPPAAQPQASGAQTVGPQPEPLDLAREDISFATEEEGAPNFILDQIELIDTLAVSGAYIWLCCGVSLLLLLPLFLLVLYVRGRSRILQEESYY